jgi:hypothetical protein
MKQVVAIAIPFEAKESLLGWVSVMKAALVMKCREKDDQVEKRENGADLERGVPRLIEDPEIWSGEIDPPVARAWANFQWGWQGYRGRVSGCRSPERRSNKDCTRHTRKRDREDTLGVPVM